MTGVQERLCSGCGMSYERGPIGVQNCKWRGIPASRYHKGDMVQFWGGQMFHKAVILALSFGPSFDGEVNDHNHTIWYLAHVLDGPFDRHIIAEDDPDCSQLIVDSIVGRFDERGFVMKAPKRGSVRTWQERNQLFEYGRILS